MGSSKKVTVGYKYYVGMHMVFTHGPVDKLLQIQVDSKEAWGGTEQIGSGQIYINQPDLFGGESREGGVEGHIDFETGHSTQVQNTYLLSKLGTYTPAFRGVCAAILKQVYIGLNPYLKLWKFRISRVHTRQHGIAQWYDSKAEIASYSDELGQQLRPYSTGWKYLQTVMTNTADYSALNFDDSAWPSGQTPFGSPDNHPYSVASGFPEDPATYVTMASGSKNWVRKHFTISQYRDYQIESFGDNRITIYVNGVMLANSLGGDSENFYHVTTIPASILNVGGDNVIAAFISGQGEWSYIAFKKGFAQYDMNPAHIIRECLTDPNWGMGYQDADIDDTSFMAAADKLFDEEMGISLLWDTQTSIEEFIKVIVQHIDAALYVDRTTGKFVLKLIRNDYIVSSLQVLDEHSIEKISDFSRPVFGELVNSVTVTYWDFATDTDSTVTVQDIALSQMQGTTINTSLQYPGFTNSNIATRVAQRDLATLSVPLITCTIYANREASTLNIGSVFKLTWPDFEINEMVMRVAGIAYGDGRNNRIRLQCVQDLFTLPAEAFIPPTDTSWTDPSQAPTKLIYNMAFEAPYLELVQTEGQDDIDAIIDIHPEVGYVGGAAVRSGSAISARLFVDYGDGYTDVGNLDFSPGCRLTADITELQTTFGISDGVDLDNVTLNTWFQIDAEIMCVTTISTSSITAKRGCLDTLPAKHLANAGIVFWDEFATGDTVQIVTSDIPKIKICPVSGSGQLSLFDADELTFTAIGRAARPYPPANIRLNNTYYPKYLVPNALTTTWVHRDRKQQTAAIYGFTDASIGPEVGTTYSMDYFDEIGVVRRLYTDILGQTQTWTTESEDSLLNGGLGATITHFESFVTGIPGSFGTLVSETGPAPTVSWNGSYQAAELTSSATNIQTYWNLTTFPLMTEMDFTADIEFINDYDPIVATYPQQGVGLWLSGLTAPEGINITHAQHTTTGADQWNITRWTSAWARVDANKASAPTFIPGMRVKMRVTWSSSTGLFSFYVDGSLVFTHTDTVFKQLRPGIFFYHSKIMLHEIYLTGRVAVSRLNNKFQHRIASNRSGLQSFQIYDHSVTRVGYGYSYGLSYGGL